MDKQVNELKLSLKELIQNLIKRITPICNNIDNEDGKERLSFLLEDLTLLTETIIILAKYDAVEIEVNTFNEYIVNLLDSIEDKDYSLASDLLQHEILPLLSYWDGCITNV